MEQESLLNVFKRNQYNLHNASRKSKAWFDQQVTLISKQNVTPNKVLGSDSNQLTTALVPGNLYMFFYDAKHKATLPYWDRFPLVFPFKKTEDGFMGLNMHYLPYQMRVQLLDKLMGFANNKTLDETTKLKFSWALIDGVSKYQAASPCVKQYLDQHVKSPFRKVNGNDWATAMLLPVESFVGSNKQLVWADSKRIIRK
jgi:hypothetical protein